MGVRVLAGVACVAVALLGLSLATPQDATLTVGADLKDLFDPRGANVGSADEDDLGKLLEGLDPDDLDPDLLRNLDPDALAQLLQGLDEEQLAALGLTREEAQDLIDQLRDPDLTPQELAAVAAVLAAAGFTFVNDDGDGRFDAGEVAYADVDGDGQVSAADVRLGVLAFFLGVDRGLPDEAREALRDYERAGLLGLAKPPRASVPSTADAATAPLLAAGYPTDRSLGPAAVLCVQVASPGLTCHTRTAAHSALVAQGDHYVFRTAAAERIPIPLEPGAPGTQASVHAVLRFQGNVSVPVPALTPGDRLVAHDGAGFLTLLRDGDGTVWAHPHAGTTGERHLNVTWAIDLAYYDLPVAADVTAADVPAALRPAPHAVTQAVGSRIAELAGANGRDYGDAIRALRAYAADFAFAPLPDRDQQADDLLAIAEAKTGCARHRAAVLVAGMQALGIPARFVLNEAHAFTEAYVPGSGWHLVDAGTCGQVQVKQRAGHVEVMALQDLPYASGQAPASQAERGRSVAARIDITHMPPTVRPGQDFAIRGVVDADKGQVPSGVPITFTYNQTKEAPGTPFCSAGTLAGERFDATCRLPADMPNAPNGGWQLVARLAPTVVDGAATKAAYSDPPFVVQKATTLTIEGAQRTSADVPGAVSVHLLDEDGRGVPQRDVRLRVDGAAGETRVTDASGRARFTLTVPVGGHVLAADFAGDDSYDASQAERTLEAVATPRISLALEQADLDSGTMRLRGEVRGADGAPLANRALQVRWANQPDAAPQTRDVRTGSDGRFTAQLPGEVRPGPGLVAVRDDVTGTTVAAAFARTVDATARLEAPTRWAAGFPVPVTVNITGPADPVPVRVTLDGLAVAAFEAGDQRPGTARIVVPPGRHVIGLEAGQGVRMARTTATIDVAAANLTLDPASLVGGRDATVTGTARFADAPYSGPVHVRLQGDHATATSGADGRFNATLALAAGTPPGNATLVASLPEVGFVHEVPVRVLRPAVLVLDVPRLSLHAFGSTPLAVRGEGIVQVTVDGEPLAGARIEVPSRTWTWRTLAIEATSQPSDPDAAPTTVTADVLVVNPVVAGLAPLLALGLVVGGIIGAVRLRRWLRWRNRLLPPRPRGPIQVVHPALPRRVPLAFDPRIDGHVLVRLPNARPWALLDARGRRLPLQQEGDTARIPLDKVPVGVHDAAFVSERRRVPFPFLVMDLRDALDHSTLGLLRRAGSTSPWPAPLAALQEALRKAGTPAAAAHNVRSEAEGSLYAVESIDRDRFHAFFAAVHDAQTQRGGPT